MLNRIKNARRQFHRFPLVLLCLCRGSHQTPALSHYDALGLSIKASQSDIKTAYYKLSKIYHPDNKEGGNDKKFREITSAYEVLGNTKLRRMYDLGFDRSDDILNPNFDIKKYERFTEDLHQSYSTIGKKSIKKVPMTGKSRHYDFDEWSKAHYSSTFAKSEEHKAKREFIKKTLVEDNTNSFHIFLFVLIFGFFGIGIVGTTITSFLEYDKPLKSREK